MELSGVEPESALVTGDRSSPICPSRLGAVYAERQSMTGGVFNTFLDMISPGGMPPTGSTAQEPVMIKELNQNQES